jgi:hypothetical protein
MQGPIAKHVTTRRKFLGSSLAAFPWLLSAGDAHSAPETAGRWSGGVQYVSHERHFPAGYAGGTLVSHRYAVGERGYARDRWLV